MFFERTLGYRGCLCRGALFCFYIVLQEDCGLIVDIGSAAVFGGYCFEDYQSGICGEVIIADGDGDIIFQNEDMFGSGGLEAGKSISEKVEVLADERGGIDTKGGRHQSQRYYHY